MCEVTPYNGECSCIPWYITRIPQSAVHNISLNINGTFDLIIPRVQMKLRFITPLSLIIIVHSLIKVKEFISG